VVPTGQYGWRPVGFRRFIAGLGRTLIGAGVLILLFVAYQLWGTGLFEARSQDRLRRAAPPAPLCGQGTAITNPTPPPTPEGEAIAVMKICKIGVEKAIVSGVGDDDLKKAPGHYPDTPVPGQPGNSAIAGHRTTYGAPFFRLDELDMGDPILVSTAQGRFRYEVSEKTVVTPSHVEVLDPTPDNRLTLTTCEPRFSNAKRLIVVATLVGDAVAPPPGTPKPAAKRSLAGEAGLSGERTTIVPALLWGLLATAVAAAGWLAGRRWRKLPAYLVATPVFLVVLFVFFENFSRLLPANI
jgi:sortase A